MANPHNKCDRLRATLQRRIDKGPPSIGAAAWRKKNANMLSQAQAACAEARAEDDAAAGIIAGGLPPVSAMPDAFAAGGLPATGGAGAAGLTQSEVQQYAAMGLAVTGALMLGAVLLTRG